MPLVVESFVPTISCCLDKNDSEHLCKALPALLRPFHSFRRVHLIWDGGPSHTSSPTASFLRSRYGSWLKILVTPAHSSWLNQAEILLKSFDVRYLQCGNWKSRQQRSIIYMPAHQNIIAYGLNLLTGHGLDGISIVGLRKNQPDYVKLLVEHTTSPSTYIFYF